MSPLVLTISMFGSLLICLALGVPLFGAIGAIAILFGLILEGPDIFPMFAYRVYSLMSSYPLAAVPLFIFMANLLQRCGIVEELFSTVYAWAGRVRGSIIYATIIGGAILAAMIGVVGASVISLGLIALPAMAQYRYNRRLALGSVCAAGTLGILIPPSIMPIFYSTVTSTSVVDLFAGSFLPGFLLCLFFILYVWFTLILKPEYAPASTESFSWSEKFIRLKNIVAPMCIILFVLGVIMFGVTSPTEASGIGAFAVIVAVLARKRLTWAVIRDSLLSTVTATGMAMWICFAANMFVGTYALGGGDEFISSLFLNMPGGRWAVLIVINIIYIVMGMFVDWIGICLLFVPIFSPILQSFGFDPIWVGVLFIVNMQISFLSPPFGYALFFIKGIVPKDVTTAEIWRGAAPFIVCQSLGLVLCILIPDIILYLPGVLH